MVPSAVHHIHPLNILLTELAGTGIKLNSTTQRRQDKSKQSTGRCQGTNRSENDGHKVSAEQIYGGGGTGWVIYAQSCLQTVLQEYEMLQNNTETSTRKARRAKYHSTQSELGFINMTGV